MNSGDSKSRIMQKNTPPPPYALPSLRDYSRKNIFQANHCHNVTCKNVKKNGLTTSLILPSKKQGG